ncbi:MAG: hypothetical protein A2X80_07620 [Geobacteraceae bacterium GWB2_52_12]|nr:MAG: hypothetical protein A2X80_07620 [Geobacteraceae bacterium GWB2_52_12]
MQEIKIKQKKHLNQQVGDENISPYAVFRIVAASIILEDIPKIVTKMPGMMQSCRAFLFLKLSQRIYRLGWD